jgi:hypothetical protein
LEFWHAGGVGRALDGDLEPVKLVCHEVANGSPTAMLLDRIVPPSEASMDRSARLVREVSRVRGHGEVAAWSPAIDGTRSEAEAIMQGEAEDESTPSPSP